MFIPIGDAPNPRGIPYVTWLLIAANVAAFLLFNVPLGAQRPDFDDPLFREYVTAVAHQVDSEAQLRQLIAHTSEYELFAFEHGFRPNAPRLSSLFTAMFLHGGFMHLFGNMLFLWIYGDNVERRLGVLPYLFAYLATGVVATLSHALVFPSSDMPLVGASGAISGVLGFYFVFFPRNTVRMLAFLPPFLMQVFVIPARFVLGMFLVVDNLLPFVFAGEGGVAHGAHLGGFVAGALAAWMLQRRGEGQPARIEVEPHPSSLEGVRAALGAGQLGEAARRYFALPTSVTRGALAPGDALQLASWLRGNGHAEVALTLLRRVVRDFGSGEDVAEAHALAGAILFEDLQQPTAAYQYLLSALELGASPATEERVRSLLSQIDELQKRRVGRLHSPPGW
jgi:membrane associated rhomboid family serine protease